MKQDNDHRTKMIAVIPPIPLTEHERERRRTAYRSAASAGTLIDIRLLQGGPPLTDNEYELSLATVFIILEAERAAAEGAEGIVIDCTTDPGYPEIAASLSIPVAGALRSGISRATDYIGKNGTFSVIALDENWKRMIARQIRLLGYTARMASIEVSGSHIYRPDHPEGLNISESHQVLRQLVDAGRAARTAGCDAIVLGSTTIIEEVKPLEELLGVPVIAPGLAALRDVEAALDKRISDMEAHSDISGR